MVVTLSTKGQICIPAKIRKRLGLREGAKFDVKEENGNIVLLPLTVDPVEEACGAFAGEPSLVDVLMDLRREERILEERRHRQLGVGRVFPGGPRSQDHEGDPGGSAEE